MKDKVININSKTAFRRVLEDVINADDENLIIDCVIAVRRKFNEEEIENGEHKGNSAKMTRYWFGTESSTNCLGMVSNMAFIINTYIEGYDIIHDEEV